MDQRLSHDQGHTPSSSWFISDAAHGTKNSANKKIIRYVLRHERIYEFNIYCFSSFLKCLLIKSSEWQRSVVHLPSWAKGRSLNQSSHPVILSETNSKSSHWISGGSWKGAKSSALLYITLTGRTEGTKFVLKFEVAPWILNLHLSGGRDRRFPEVWRKSKRNITDSSVAEVFSGSHKFLWRLSKSCRSWEYNFIFPLAWQMSINIGGSLTPSGFFSLSTESHQPTGERSREEEKKCCAEVRDNQDWCKPQGHIQWGEVSGPKAVRLSWK